jgi:hypothetical protein
MTKISKYFKYKFLSGHINIFNITIYGRNAMHWGVNIYTKKYGYICFRLPLPCFGKWWPLYLYFSPDATPCKSTFFIGKNEELTDWSTSRIRYQYLGHNYNIESNRKTLNSIKYFYPGNNNIIIDLLKRSKAEIKAYYFHYGFKEAENKLLISDLERYIKLYSEEEENDE